MKISVIIPTYNRINSIQRTFEYIVKSDTFPDEVIVVDQTQNPDLADSIKRLCDSQIFPVNYIWRF